MDDINLFNDTAAAAALARRARNKRSDAEKLAIIAEHLRGETIDAVQRRHGLGHSTLRKWLDAYGIQALDGRDARLLTTLARDNARLANKVSALEGALAEMRRENAGLRGKIRAARTALQLTTAAVTDSDIITAADEGADLQEAPATDADLDAVA